MADYTDNGVSQYMIGADDALKFVTPVTVAAGVIPTSLITVGHWLWVTGSNGRQASAGKSCPER